jgi:hypothetical protein
MARELYSVLGTKPIRVGTPGVQRSDFEDFKIHGPAQMKHKRSDKARGNPLALRL